MAKTGPIADLLIWVPIRVFLFVIGRIPRRFSRWICGRIALLIYYLDGKHRRIGMYNLGVAFPDQSESWRQEILRKSFIQLGENAADVCRLEWVSEEEIRRLVRYEPGFGLEHYRQAKAEGKGLIFLTAHISAWELLPTAHAILGHPLSFIVRPLENRHLDRWALRTRERFGNRVLSKFGSLREVLRIIRKGEDVGILIDQNVQEKDGVFAPFFGMPAATTVSAAALALKTGAPVIAGFMTPDLEKGKYLIRFYPPIFAERGGDPEEDLVRNTARFNSYIEEVLREHPHCWLWGHRRFATRPDGSNPYK